MTVGLVFCVVIVGIFMKSLAVHDAWRYRILTLFFLTLFFCGYFWVYHAGQWSQYHQYLALTPQSTDEKMFKYELIKRHLKKLHRTHPQENNLKHLYQVCVQTNDYPCIKTSALDLIERGVVPNDSGLQLVRSEYHLHHEKMSQALLLALSICKNTKEAASCRGYHARALFNSGDYEAAKQLWHELLKQSPLTESAQQLFNNAIKQCDQKLAESGGKSS